MKWLELTLKSTYNLGLLKTKGGGRGSQVKEVMRSSAKEPASIHQQILLRDYVPNIVLSARHRAMKTGKVPIFREFKF